MERRVWRDGALIGWDEATISTLAHSMQRGSLVFDVLSFHRTQRGVAVFRLREHVVRFLRSAFLVGMEIPFDEATLRAATRSVVAASGLDEGLIRISGFFAGFEPDLVPADPRGSVVVAAYGRNDFPKKKPSPKILKVGIGSLRKASPDVLPPQAKVAASYLGPMLARRRCLEAGYDEVVLLDDTGAIAEAPTANAFAVHEGTLTTPPLGKILDGITRDTVLRLAEDEGIPTREATMLPLRFKAADEVFLTASSYAIAPVESVDGAKMKQGAPGPITARLKARFDRLLAGDDPRAEHWLEPVS